MIKLFKTTLAFSALASLWVAPASAQSIRTNPGFKLRSIPANDDGSSPLVPLGFTINFFGQTRTSCYVNNNGNITFDSALPSFTPFGLDSVHKEIIAAFFADVDTRAPRSSLVTYGNDTVNGHIAFGVNYINVGYFNTKDDKLNSFQLVLIDRSDLGPGNFDLEFNYAAISWETGAASGGVGGVGGVSAAVGWSNGTGLPGTSFELPGSLVPGSFLGNGPQSLVNRRQYRNVVGIPAGRFGFRARNGVLLQGMSIVSAGPLGPVTVGDPVAIPLLAIGGTTYRWTMLTDPGQNIPWLSLTPGGILTGIPPATGVYDFTVSVTSKIDDIEFTDVQRASLTVVPPSLLISERSCPLPAAVAGSAFRATLAATGGAGPFVWSWGNNSPIPGLTLSEAGIISGTPSRAGNYLFDLRVASAKAGAAEPASRQCALTVQPSLPDPAIMACPAGSVTVGVPVNELLQAAGGNGPYLWSASGTLPSGLTVDPSGIIAGIPQSDGSFPFSLALRDQKEKTFSKNCSITASKPSINLTTACPLPSGVTGASYNQKVAASGGQAPYAWTTLGNFPAGLSIAPDGSITGRPNDGGAYQFRLQAEDALGRKVSVPCSLSVSRADLSINACPLAPGRVNAAYSQSLTVVGGAGPLLWSSSGRMPAGLYVSSPGLLSGVPTEAGDFRFGLNVRDASGLSASQDCSFTIAPNPIKLSRACPTAQPTVGDAFSFEPLVTGGIAPYSWSVNGTLPVGISLGKNGTLAGTPSRAGSADFDILVRDAQYRLAAETCTLNPKLPPMPQITFSGSTGTVAPALSPVPVTLEVSEAYSLPIEATVEIKASAETGSVSSETNQPDPAVRFTSGSRSTVITIPAGVRRVPLNLNSTGTVASQTRLAVTKLVVGGQALPLLPSPGLIRVLTQAPVLSDACYRVASPGLQLDLTGFSTTRDLAVANLTLNGTKLPALSLAELAGDYYSGPLSIRTGGAFLISAPVTIASTSVKVDSLTVVVTNRTGASATRSVRACQ